MSVICPRCLHVALNTVLSMHLIHLPHWLSVDPLHETEHLAISLNCLTVLKISILGEFGKALCSGPHKTEIKVLVEKSSALKAHVLIRPTLVAYFYFFFFGSSVDSAFKNIICAIYQDTAIDVISNFIHQFWALGPRILRIIYWKYANHIYQRTFWHI